jgi:hypothetical protein
MASQNRRQVARASVSNGKGDDVAASAAYRCPHPPFVLLFLHTTPAFISFEHIAWCCRQKGLFDLWPFLDGRFEPTGTTLPWPRSVPLHGDCNVVGKPTARYGAHFLHTLALA